MLKPFACDKNSVPSKWGPKWRFWGNGVETLDYGFATPKRHFLARLTYFASKSVHASTIAFLKNQKISESLCRGARNHECTEPIWIKVCIIVDITDIVTYTNFGDHRLMSFWVAGGQISPFPIDFHRRPYNTLALPCERVITRRCML